MLGQIDVIITILLQETGNGENLYILNGTLFRTQQSGSSLLG